MTSFGDALPDQLSALLGTAAAQQALATDLAAMLAERAALEREYAGRLQAITRKARERRDRRVLEAAVGPEPNRTVSAEEAKDSSLQKYITFALHTSDGAANRAATLAEQLDGVSNELAAGARKREAVVKKHGAFGTKVLAERDRFHSERTKAKSKYDESCAELEAARAKKVAAEADGKHVERATKAWKEAQDTMESAKNTYLCAIAVSNRANSHFYKATLPALHDNLQALWTLSSSRLVSSLSTASTRVLAHEQALASGEEASLAAAQNVDAPADQEFYVKFNQRPHWNEPPPVTYEPAPGFYDTEEMKEGEAARVQLQNRLLKARARVDELVPVIEAKRREAEGLERLRAAYEGDAALGNPDDVMDNLLDALRETTALELQVAVCEAEIEEVVAVIGEDSSDARPHRFTQHNFTIPTTCGLCQSTMWGISGRNALICKPCGYTCHAKCEAKVPPKCRAGNKPTHRATGSVSLGRSSTSASTRTTGSRLSMPALASPTRTVAPPPARALPPPQAAAPAASGTMLYAYDAAAEGEVSVQAGEAVEVLADDDGGWLSVRTGAGGSGLVPTSYVDLTSSSSSAGAPTRAPAAAAPAQGCGEFVVALFDYAAQDDDELDLVAGELVELTTAGLAYADGWAQGVKVGRVGVFPRTYVRPDEEE